MKKLLLKVLNILEIVTTWLFLALGIFALFTVEEAWQFFMALLLIILCLSNIYFEIKKWLSSIQYDYFVAYMFNNGSFTNCTVRTRRINNFEVEKQLEKETERKNVIILSIYKIGRSKRTNK